VCVRVVTRGKPTGCSGPDSRGLQVLRWWRCQRERELECERERRRVVKGSRVGKVGRSSTVFILLVPRNGE
jgi:hypothetical protein